MPFLIPLAILAGKHAVQTGTGMAMDLAIAKATGMPYNVMSSFKSNVTDISGTGKVKQMAKVLEVVGDTKKAAIITGKVPHGNSKNSTKQQHGYNIFEKETGNVVKTGISGRPLNKNGTSPRANSQVNKLNEEARYNKYEADVVKPNISNRQEALDWERENAQRLWDAGNEMNKHQRPKPWE